MLPLIVTVTLLGQAPGLEIAAQGRTDYVIAISADASPSERFGAGELADFLGQISGARFPIVETAEPPARAIVVGGLAGDESLGDEGYVLRTEGERLIIAGGKRRGAMYGCYGLLEDVLGCRWWSATGSTIPRMDRLVIPPLDERVVPILEYREPFWGEAFDGLWCARNRQNSSHASLTEEMGGKTVYTGFVHTFYSLVPPDQYFADHPEYFSLIDGKRTTSGGQLCLTNPEVVRIAAETAKQWIRDNPETDIVSVSQNDWHGNCQCDNCRAVDEREGSPSGSMIQFVNQVAEIVEEEFPEVAIDTLAYQYTRRPPKTLRPRDNVIVRLCSIECCFSHGLEACPTNQSFEDDIVGWSEICDRLYVWNYTTIFPHYVSPFPNLHAMGPDLKFLVDHSVVGLFEQGAYPPGGGGEFSELRAWVQAKLMWDPTLDPRALIEEFVEGYYGPAAKPILEWIDVFNDRVIEEDIHVNIWTPPTASHLTDELVAQGLELFDAALERVDGDATLSSRVARQRLPLEYAQIMRWSTSERMRYVVDAQGARIPGGEQYQAAVEHFAAEFQAQGIQEIREGGGTFQPWLESVRGKFVSSPTVTVKAGGLTAYLLPEYGARVARLADHEGGRELVALPQPEMGDLGSGGIAFTYGASIPKVAFEATPSHSLLSGEPEPGVWVGFGAVERDRRMALVAEIKNNREEPLEIAPRLLCALAPDGATLRLRPEEGFTRYIQGGNDRTGYVVGDVTILAPGETWSGSVTVDRGRPARRLLSARTVRSYCGDWRYYLPPDFSGTRVVEGAEMGVAGYLTGHHVEWAIQWPVADGLLRDGARYRVRARIRAEVVGDQGGALTAGVWHSASATTNCTTALSAEAATGDWEVIEVGVVEWRDGGYAWLAPAANPANVPEILVDWIEFEEVARP